MADHSAWADLVQKWQPLPDWIKAVIAIATLAYLVMLLHLARCHRREIRRAEAHCDDLAKRIRSMGEPGGGNWPKEAEELRRILSGSRDTDDEARGR